MFKQSAIGWALVVLAGCLMMIGSWAEDVLVQDYPVPDLNSLVNQFGEPFKGQDSMELVMLVAGMKVKNMVRETQSDIDASCLQEGRVVYLANISGMPKLVSKLIAVPRLRDLPYPVWLDYAGDTTTGLPFKKGQVTLVSLDHGRQSSSVVFADSQEALRERLLAECGSLAD